MKYTFLVILLLSGCLAYAQFNKDAPWMEGLEKKSRATSKSGRTDLPLHEISDAFQKYWADKDPNVKGSGFKPYMRWENYWKHMVDREGYLPTPAEYWNSWKNRQLSSKAPNPTANWTSIGPFSHGIYAGQLPGQGRINAVAVDPNNANTWYAGAPAGGLWRSDNAGQTWTNLFDDFPQIGVSGIAIDPNNSDIIYIATGDDDAADSYSIGVFKSVNGGATWQQTGLNPGNTTVSTLMNEITIDPTNSNTIWAGTNGGLFKSVDGGATFEVKQVGPITDFKLKPDDPNTVYAVTNSVYYRSTDGENFSIVSDILPTTSSRRVLGVTPADPEVVYILTAANTANLEYQGLYKSTDAGLTFTESPNTTNIMESNQAWFDLALEVSPTDANELYMGCLNVWKSLNGGDSWIRLNQWFSNTPAYTHADIHTLKFFDGKLFCGSDGGFYVSENNGISFTDYTAGMAVGQIYKLSVSKQNAGRMISGLQDNGGQVLEFGSWNNYHGGDGMDNAIDPNNSDIVYGFIQFGSLLNISTNAGQSIGVVQSPSGGSEQGNWITPLAISSTGEVYSGFDAVHKLNGNSWEQLSDPIGVDDIEDLEVDPTDPQVIYAAESNGIYRSSDGGNTFTAFFFADPDAIISDMAINVTDGSAVYITTSFRVGVDQSQQLTKPRGVFKIPVRPDGSAGLETDLTLNLPTDQAFFAIVHQGRHTDNPIYVGTNLGVYRLDDTLAEWEEYFTNLPGVAVSDLEISLDDELITASTYGRGVWQSPIPIQIPDNDIRLLALTPPNDAVSCGPAIPEILVENNGLNPITQVDITYSIDGGPDMPLTETVNLSAGETTQIPLPVLDPTPPAITTLQVNTTIANDAFADNNTLSQRILFNNSGIVNYINTFETAEEDLLAYNEGGTGSLWEKGVPSGPILNQVGSGTQAFATNLAGDHTDATTALLLTDCYDFTTIQAPVLRFNMAYDLEINFDIVFVQYSIDNGATWQVLGSVNSQPNWYNSDRTNASSGADDDCQNCPGAQWTGTNAEMTEYAYDFVLNAINGETDLTQESNLIFRIVFKSDPAVVQEGAVIDDIVVTGLIDDEDDDDDGVLDVDDNCPLIANSNQLDNDNDGIGDACDPDDDNDGIPDTDDNCQFTANADQADFDQDGIGDSCDDDIDNDGVLNNVPDLCNDTPPGTTVGLDGCEVFSLPGTNFRISTKGESCIDNNDGNISIEAEEMLDYTAVLTGDGVNETLNFSNSALFENLLSGTYELCITVAGQPGYELCFDLNVPEPEPLSVSSKVNTLDSKVTLDLEGGTRYTITLNGTRYTTREKQIELPLDRAANMLVITTDKACQGMYEELIIMRDELFIYPNPVGNNALSVYLSDLGVDKAEVSLYTLSGVRVYNKRQAVSDREMQLYLNGLPNGIYLLNVRAGQTLLKFKVWKR